VLHTHFTIKYIYVCTRITLKNTSPKHLGSNSSRYAHHGFNQTNTHIPTDTFQTVGLKQLNIYAQVLHSHFTNNYFY